MRKRVEVKVRLPRDMAEALSARKERTGKSVSMQVEEALRNDLLVDRVRSELENLGRMLAEERELRARVEEVLVSLESRFAAIEQWVRVIGLWAAVTPELIRTRFFNQNFRQLSQAEMKEWEKKWDRAFEFADARVEQLTGERIWRGRFDPRKPPVTQG